AVKKKTGVESNDARVGQSPQDSHRLNQKLDHDEPAEIPTLGEKSPNHGRAELHERYGAHHERRDHRRMALIAYKREDVKVQAGDADVSNTESYDDKPEGRRMERLATAPRDIIAGASSGSGCTFFFRRWPVIVMSRSSVRQESHVFRAAAHKEQGRPDDQSQSHQAEDGPGSAPSRVQDERGGEDRHTDFG